ncbi:FAD-binding domain-containing protein [Promicromonospora sp. CA-289599]|uniref:FAD-binding domain-containing protein n=1 Tax=Promicromonospora sp. CA-289599 TaxID=3240014 RepID=UPI003D8B14A6
MESRSASSHGATYADVLDQRPDSARRHYDRSYDVLRTDSGPDADRLFTAWKEGRTGFPTIDGGPPAGYPAPVVDRQHERAEALVRLEAVRESSRRERGAH